MLPGGVRAGVARGCQSWCCQGVSELVLPGGDRAGVAKGCQSWCCHRVRTHPGKPGIYWNLTIRIPGLEYTGISSKVLENTGI